MTTTSQKNHSSELVVSLTDSSVGTDRVAPSRVGGKASSLATLYGTEGLGSRVPKAHALTVDFFDPWVEELKTKDDFQSLSQAVKASNQEDATAICSKLQASSLELGLSEAQSEAIRRLAVEMNGKLAAVRSSAPEEDGSGASFAGAFETKLAVETTFEGLERAIKECFASLWDYRVLLYKQKQYQESSTDNIGFAVVVMEMVDSVIAGVAFSANPLNSDRDEIVIDSSWGLGESVVDGSVTADRYIVDKIQCGNVIEESIGKKGNEKRIGAGGVLEIPIKMEDPRCLQSSLSREQIRELSELVCLIEKTYEMPMDIEWAFVNDGEKNSPLKPRLLQARPITTLYCIDPNMMTKPGAKRNLYYDFNIVSEATTTSPFTTLDMSVYSKVITAFFGISLAEIEEQGFDLFNYEDPRSFFYNGMTRQYMNFGWVLKYISTKALAAEMEMMDPYLASIVRSKDCDRKKYRTKYWLPKGLKLKTFLKAIQLGYNPGKSRRYAKDPITTMRNYRHILKASMEQFENVVNSDSNRDDIGLNEFSSKLSTAMKNCFLELVTMIWPVVGLFNELDKKRRNGKTEEIREDYEALCGGYEGDELMEINIALYKLAQLMPKDIWKEYIGENGMAALTERIVEGRDLPAEFLNEWKSFIHKYGFDGQDQLFIGCPRYSDDPERLVEKLRLNANGHVKDPSVIAKDQLKKRRAIMIKQEDEAKRELTERSTFWNKRRLEKKLSKIQHRNAFLDNMMMIRNSPKLRVTELVGAMRNKVLRIEEKLLSRGRLEEKGDIFHLTMEELDEALLSEEQGGDLMKIIRPRKAIYKRALASTTCPLLVDSRCRIIKPDPPAHSEEPGTFVGSAISPGVATGKVRIIRDLSAEQTRGFGVGPDGEEESHVLCAVVTGPAWTPLFASASAVVLQIGGVLQHGALCAREYGKPAVSNIDVYSVLKDGMTVSVDGNTGIVKILDDVNGNL